MYNRFHQPDNGDGERVRGRTKTGQSKDARDDKERWSIAEEEYPMVSRSRQLQRYGRKSSRKLLLVPSLVAKVRAEASDYFSSHTSVIFVSVKSLYPLLLLYSIFR